VVVVVAVARAVAVAVAVVLVSADAASPMAIFFWEASPAPRGGWFSSCLYGGRNWRGGIAPPHGAELVVAIVVAVAWWWRWHQRQQMPHPPRRPPGRPPWRRGEGGFLPLIWQGEWERGA
jgi:hypothetical protein